MRDLLADFDDVSLDAMDERAALLRRVDNKYVIPEDRFADLLRCLRSDHEVLEIESRRVFRYSTIYFDTPDLRCFLDHVEDRVPRFKARTRFYEDTGECVFEVKLKRSEDETDKRQIKYAPDDRRRLTDEGSECVRSALGGAGLPASQELSPSLTTSFERVTLAASSGSERLTCDFGVQLTGPDGETAAMRSGLVLIETKSEAGDSPADRQLARMQLEPISLSKYRVGMSTVGGADRYGAQPGSDLFER